MSGGSIMIDPEIVELRQLFREVAEMQKKTDEKIDKLAKLYGNVSKNQGDVAEEFFYNTIKINLKIGNLQFYDISLNMFKERGGIKDEFDIVVTNGDSIAIIEVKYKAHENDVEKLKEKKISNFRKLYPIYKDYKIYAGIAGFHISESVLKKAEEYGFFVLKRNGNIIECATDFMKEQLAS